MAVDYIWDIESYANVFTATIERADTEDVWQFEYSHRRNDLGAMIQFLTAIKPWGGRLVGFNSIGFDYPVLHYIVNNSLTATPQSINAKVQEIINDMKLAEQNPGSNLKFKHRVRERDEFIPQLDLYLIHHFDNKAKTASLKLIEFNMRLDDVQDLPFEPGATLTDAEIDVLLRYNRHDVKATKAFYHKSIDAIRFREELTAKYGMNMMNFNDTKIGKKYFIMKLEEAMPGCCYDAIGVRQTRREFVNLRDVILPYIRFERPEFNAVKQFFENATVPGNDTKGVFKDLSAKVNGFQIDYGVGGIHGSVSSRTFRANDEYEIRDADVTSLYPSIAIVNRIYPAHLGETFCDIYADLKEQRVSYAKGTAENMMLKLALNGVYGDSNSPYSPFYDPQYMLAITVNGQLLLSMLAEQLVKIPGLEIIQVNTDGITVYMPRAARSQYDAICKWWEGVTKLDLEFADYDLFAVRDVNNYLARTVKGKVKRKGAYEYLHVDAGGTLGWHQNHSSLVVPMAAEAAIMNGESVRDYILNHDEIFDFMLRAKVPRTNRLQMHTQGTVTELQKICRYYVSKSGGSLVKIMPPLAKNPNKDRHIGINVGFLCTEANNITKAVGTHIDMEYYIKEAEKLVKPLQRGLVHG